MDTVDRETRSKIMARVGQKDTGAEILLRKALHRIGLRYKLHDKALSGRPDIVLPRFNAVIFVHGCYWHSHGCYRSTMPKSRRKFWREKFDANMRRDERNRRSLLENGWRVLTIWECSLRGRSATPAAEIAVAVKERLDSSQTLGEIGASD